MAHKLQHVVGSRLAPATKHRSASHRESPEMHISYARTATALLTVDSCSLRPFSVSSTICPDMIADLELNMLGFNALSDA